MSPAQLRAMELGVRLSRELLVEARATAEDAATGAPAPESAKIRRRRIEKLRKQLEAALEATAAPGS